MFTRQRYIDQLLEPSEKMKVRVGVRRSGKSALLENLWTALRRQGVASEQIQLIDFNWLKDRRLLRPDFLLAAIQKKLVDGKENYLFLDELEIVTDFLPLLKRLMTIPRLHMVITGSTTKTLQTLEPIRSDCQIIQVLPLSYPEYLSWHQLRADHQSLLAYLNDGGFPFAQSIHEADSRQNYIQEVVNTTMMAAFVRQDAMCKPSLTTHLARLLVQHVGQPLNVSQIVSQMSKAGTKASNKTVSTYLRLLGDTFLFLPCYEYNPLTSQKKSTTVRYFPIDPSIKNTLTRHHSAISAENLIALAFLRLYSQGRQVASVHFKGQTITFVANNGEESHYFQFAYSLTDQDQYQQVIAPLLALPTKVKKTLLVAKKPQWLLREDSRVEHRGFLEWLSSVE